MLEFKLLKKGTGKFLELSGYKGSIRLLIQHDNSSSQVVSMLSSKIQSVLLFKGGSGCLMREWQTPEKKLTVFFIWVRHNKYVRYSS